MFGQRNIGGYDGLNMWIGWRDEECIHSFGEKVLWNGTSEKGEWQWRL